jgi:hypothetical protein
LYDLKYKGGMSKRCIGEEVNQWKHIFLPMGFNIVDLFVCATLEDIEIISVCLLECT